MPRLWGILHLFQEGRAPLLPPLYGQEHPERRWQVTTSTVATRTWSSNEATPEEMGFVYTINSEDDGPTNWLIWADWIEEFLPEQLWRAEIYRELAETVDDFNQAVHIVKFGPVHEEPATPAVMGYRQQQYARVYADGAVHVSPHMVTNLGWIELPPEERNGAADPCQYCGVYNWRNGESLRNGWDCCNCGGN